MENVEPQSIPPVRPSSDQPFKSKLSGGPQRFLAYVVDHALREGRRVPQDFIRQFPPSVIMEGLRDQPQLRANILVIATGIRMRVALKKDAVSSGNDLQIALDEGEADAETVVSLFDPDDRVRFLDNAELWHFVTEGSFWETEAKKDPTGHAYAAGHIGYMIDRGLEDQLLTHRDVVEGIQVTKLGELLPRSELAKIIEAALTAGAGKQSFVERSLLEATPAATLTKYVPLPWIWNRVIVPRIAEAHGFAPKPPAAKSEEPFAAPTGTGSSMKVDAARAPAAAAPPASTPMGSLRKAPRPKDATANAAGGDDDGLDVDFDVDEVVDVVGDQGDPTVVKSPVKAPFRR